MTSDWINVFGSADQSDSLTSISVKSIRKIRWVASTLLLMEDCKIITSHSVPESTACWHLEWKWSCLFVAWCMHRYSPLLQAEHREQTMPGCDNGHFWWPGLLIAMWC